MDHEACTDALGRELDRFVSLLTSADPDAPVPTCPEWTVRDLTDHLGYVHRWAGEMVRDRSPERLPREEMTFETATDDDLARWLRAGGDALIATLRDADPDDEMWAWGPDQRVRFWSRRQLHETAIHRIDLARAVGAPVVLDAPVALDSILELLECLPSAADFSPHIAELRGDGETIGLRATDSEGAGTIMLIPDGFTFTRALGDADATISGTINDLALVISRRHDPNAPGVEFHGRTELIAHWLDHSWLG